MESASAGQLGKSGADVKGGLLSALQTDLQLINGIARALDPDNPGLADKFPAASNSDNSITSTADAYLSVLEIKPADTPAVQAEKTALQQLFITHEMPATFVAELRTDRDAVNPAATAHDNKDFSKVQSTASLRAQDGVGMKHRGQIAAACEAKYSRVPDKLAAARSAFHIHRAPKRGNGPTASAAAPVSLGARRRHASDLRWPWWMESLKTPLAPLAICS
jgi:hypothetical protein